jgi:hypothetical protein
MSVLKKPALFEQGGLFAFKESMGKCECNQYDAGAGNRYSYARANPYF